MKGKLRITSAGPQTWEAEVVSSVKDIVVEIQTGSQASIEIGQSFYLLNAKGKKKGIVRVIEVHEGSATGELIKGVAEKGWSAAPKAQTSSAGWARNGVLVERFTVGLSPVFWDLASQS